MARRSASSSAAVAPESASMRRSAGMGLGRRRSSRRARWAPLEVRRETVRRVAAAARPRVRRPSAGAPTPARGAATGRSGSDPTLSSRYGRAPADRGARSSRRAPPRQPGPGPRPTTCRRRSAPDRDGSSGRAPPRRPPAAVPPDPHERDRRGRHRPADPRRAPRARALASHS